MLDNDGLPIQGSWDDRPSGCSFGPMTHYNVDPNGSQPYHLHFQTATDHEGSPGGTIEIVGYGDLSKKCYNLLGAECDIVLPGSMDTFTLIAKSSDAWKFTISGNVARLLSYKTTTNGEHYPSFPTWMDNDEFDYEQTYKLVSNWYTICKKLKVRILLCWF